MNSPAEDVKDFIELSSTGLDWTFGTDMFIGDMPESPDNCICIKNSGGYPPQPNYTYLRPSIQIRVRGSIQGYQSAWSDSENLRDALHGVTGETLNGTYYVQILATSEPMELGTDKNGRPLFSINFDIQRY